MYDHSPGCWVYRFFICSGRLATTYWWWIRVWRFSWRVWFYRRRSNFNESINEYFFDDFNWSINVNFFNNFYGAVNENLFDDFNRFFYYDFFDYFFRGLLKKFMIFFFRFSTVALTVSSSRVSVAFFVCSSAIC